MSTPPLDLNERTKALADELLAHPMFSRPTVVLGTTIILRHFTKFSEAMEKRASGEFEVGTPEVFFQCDSGVFKKGGLASICYTTSKEYAQWIAGRLNELEAMEKRVKELELLRSQLHAQIDSQQEVGHRVILECARLEAENVKLHTERDQLAGLREAADELADALNGFLGEGQIEQEIKDARTALSSYRALTFLRAQLAKQQTKV